MTESNNGWRFVINVPPRVEKPPFLEWKPSPPHLAFPIENSQYKYAIQNELANVIESPFKCPVKVTIHSYMDNRRVQYPTNVAHALCRALVPVLVEDPRLLREIVATIHYPPAKGDWSPRSELIVEPIVE